MKENDEGTGEEPPRARPVAGGCSRTGVRHQRRADPRALHRHLRHRCPYLRLGRVGAEDDSGADGDWPRVCRRDRRSRLERERLSSRRHRQRRRARHLRALPQLPCRPPASVRVHLRRRRESPRCLRGICRAADEQHLAARAECEPGGRRDLRSVRQRSAHGALVPGAGRRCADHRRRADRHHVHSGGEARGRAARRHHGPESVPAGAGAQDGRDPRREHGRDAAARGAEAAWDAGRLRRGPRDVRQRRRPFAT